MTTQSTQIGKFPKIWKIDRVDSVFEIQQGKQVSQVNRIGNNQRSFLRTKNVFWGRIELSELDQMNFTETEELRLTLKPNDLLMCEGGDIGRTALWDRDIQRCYYQNHLHRLRTINKQAHAQFFAYWFWYAFVNTTIYSGRANVTTIPNLSRSRLAELPVVIPPLTEQKKIAHILSTVQRAIQAQEQIIQTTTELFKTMSHQLMTAQIRVTKEDGVEKYYGGDRGITDGNPYQLPENWDESSIGDVTVKAKQRNPRKTPNEEFQYVDVSSTSRELFKIKNTTPTMGSDAPSRARNTIEKDDVIFATVRPTLQRIAVIPPSLDGQIASTGYCVLRCDKNKVYPDFLYLFLITDHFTARMAGLQRGANYPAVRNSDVKNSWLPLPPLPEQKKIAHILSTIQQKTHTAQSKKSKLETLFRTLLHELMTAKTRVSSINLIST